jgi:glucose/arabinose dehydrogenase
MNIRLILTGLVACAAIGVMPGITRAQIFVANASSGTVGEYTLLGKTVNPALISGLSQPFGIAASGGNLFVANYLAGTIGKYTTSGRR